MCSIYIQLTVDMVAIFCFILLDKMITIILSGVPHLLDDCSHFEPRNRLTPHIHTV